MKTPDERHECANRKCKHVYLNSETVWVKVKPRRGPKTPPRKQGTCPKCGHRYFYLPDAEGLKATF
jgi:hypothetical protein